MVWHKASFTGNEEYARNIVDEVIKDRKKLGTL